MHSTRGNISLIFQENRRAHKVYEFEQRKRAERSKNSNKSQNQVKNRSIIDDIPEQDRILLFNCGPMLNFSSGDAILPTRITCYCRHHNEKLGFW